jgi:predicted metal-dependent phosphoesterase TrpH
MIDLHAHTTASDGSFSPSELVALAREKKLSAVGITDHDTIAGWDEALVAGEKENIEIVPGVELSTAYDGGRFHLLGYLFDRDSNLTQVLEEIQAERGNRNAIIFENLKKLGVPLEEAEVRKFAGRDEGELGRPHFARAMVERGYVGSTQEAFDKYLADGAPGYAPKKVLSPHEAIALIHDAGGVAIWAHPPVRKKVSYDELEDRLRDWIGWGLDGLEIFYSQYTPEDEAWTNAMREKYNLIGSGGSDFHGVSKPDVHLGKVQTGQSVPPGVLQTLKERRERNATAINAA